MSNVIYFHKVNGRHYESDAMSDAKAALAEYRQAVRDAYGSLRGVTFGCAICQRAIPSKTLNAPFCQHIACSSCGRCLGCGNHAS